ncbi:hypothetical protein LIER_08768 [Lithospermum erythrorhizon]|uniref:UBN2_3 domain-containing protein n=1 Tax=Lithospermum erythrorhizon TaxID=34254 RepID=A0AAV3PDC4_LITER
MTIAFEARDKFGFVNGEIPVVEAEDPTFKKWRKVNSTLISWIFNSVSAELSKGFIYAKTTQQLWNEIAERFGKTNDPKIYELKRSIYSVKQGADSL